MKNKLIQLLISMAVLFSLYSPALQAQETNSMSGKTVLITGSTSGLGKEVAIRLGNMGATVIIHGRNAERGQEVVDQINQEGSGQAVFYQADLGSLDEVRTLAEQVKANHPSLNLLINNAGILGSSGQSERRVSTEGYELTFAVNYLSHFLLTQELLPLLENGKPARIVNVASVGQQAINFDDIMMTENFNQMGAYSQSKLAQIMFTISLAEQLDPSEITVNSLHPATFMDTPMVAQSGFAPMSTVEEGADAVMQLAVSTELDGRSGLYFNQLEEAQANAQAYDKQARDRLWSLSLELAQ